MLAALADSASTLTGVLVSRDCDLMRTGLTALGVGFQDLPNGEVLVRPPARFLAPSAPVDCGLAGTVMRFLPPIATLADGPTRFVGDEQARRRPMAPLLSGLRQLGAQVDADALPFTVTPPASGCGASVVIDSSGSSQFISGLLLVGARLPDGLRMTHRGPALPSRPHIAMTARMLTERGVKIRTPDADTWLVDPGPISARDCVIEPDLTTAAVFLAAAAATGGTVRVAGWSADSTQPGLAFAQILRTFGADVRIDERGISVTGGDLRGISVDLSDASELTPVVAALAALAQGNTSITGVGYIRGHETDRLAGLDSELGALGVQISQTPDGLEITGRGPGSLHGALMRSHADHRMAHAAALMGLRVPGVRLDDVGCTSKTMPTFPQVWQDMVAAR